MMSLLYCVRVGSSLGGLALTAWRAVIWARLAGLSSCLVCCRAAQRSRRDLLLGVRLMLWCGCRLMNLLIGVVMWSGR